tara:strand:- start:1287 stop:1901 length:615 start_codon:yes stop_codon:yes gene_type:complete
MALVFDGSANTLTGLATAGAGIPGTEVVAAGALANGAIIQVQQTSFTTNSDVAMDTAGTWYTISDLNVNITPKTNSNKILVSGHIFGETSHYEHHNHWRIARTISGGSLAPININTHSSPGNRTIMTGTVLIGYQNNHATTPTSISIPAYLDSPATTNQITYHVQLMNYNDSSANFNLNHTKDDSDTGAHERGTSWLTVMEVVA